MFTPSWYRLKDINPSGTTPGVGPPPVQSPSSMPHNVEFCALPPMVTLLSANNIGCEYAPPAMSVAPVIAPTFKVTPVNVPPGKANWVRSLAP